MKLIALIWSAVTVLSTKQVHPMKMERPTESSPQQCGYPPYIVEPLAFDVNAMMPFISAQTLKFHHDKHYVGYINNLNKLMEDEKNKFFHNMELEDLVASVPSGPFFNNAAQALNHAIFFRGITSAKTSQSPLLRTAITQSFGSQQEFEKQFNEAATKAFGSAWVWLVSPRNAGVEGMSQLKIITTANASTPPRDMPEECALLVLDVWEHAYYLDFQNDRASYIKNFWGKVNWDFVSDRLVKTLHTGRCHLD